MAAKDPTDPQGPNAVNADLLDAPPPDLEGLPHLRAREYGRLDDPGGRSENPLGLASIHRGSETTPEDGGVAADETAARGDGAAADAGRAVRPGIASNDGSAALDAAGVASALDAGADAEGTAGQAAAGPLFGSDPAAATGNRGGSPATDSSSLHADRIDDAAAASAPAVAEAPAGPAAAPADGPAPAATDDGTETLGNVLPTAQTPGVRALDVSGFEDGAVRLDLSAALADSDGGSESLSVALTGIPDGFAFRTGGGEAVGHNLGGGTWTFTPAELTDLHLAAPENWHGSLQLSLVATAADVDGSTASASQGFTVDITGVADAPTVTAADAAVLEDGEVPLDLSASLLDVDGSEAITGVVLSSADPAADGAQLFVDGVLVPRSGQDWVLDPADLGRTITLRPAPDSDADFDVSLAVTTTEADSGDTATTLESLHVQVSAVADAPSLAVADAAGAEDTAIPLDIAAALTDTDGSEVLAVTLSGVPAGATLTLVGPDIDVGSDTAIAVAHDADARLTFMGEEAGYRNSIGRYVIDTETGQITGVEIVFENASQMGSGGTLLPGQSAVDFDVAAGQAIGFFVIADGDRSNNYDALGPGRFEFRNGDGSPATIDSIAPTLWHIADDGTATALQGNTYHHGDHVGLNPDGINHSQVDVDPVSGTLTFSFEDLLGGGDRDFDDAVFSVDVGRANIAGLYAPYGLVDQGDGTWSIAPEALPHLAIVPPEGSTADFALTVTATSAEANGDTAETVAEVHVETAMSGAIWGSEDADSLSGTSGNDRIDGLAADDTIFGSAGADTIDGGSGMDTVSYSTSGAAVSVDLDKGVAQGGDAEADQLIDIENVTGSAYADALTGDGAANVLAGGAGDDTLAGGGGNDVLLGGAGNDLFIFGAGDGSDAAFGGAGWTDTIRLEQVTGGPGEGSGWTLQVEGDVGFTLDGETLDFEAEASGTILYDDGSQLTFSEIERITW